jgi:hypothetical protein
MATVKNALFSLAAVVFFEANVALAAIVFRLL